jgi:hypothetical protein
LAAEDDAPLPDVLPVPADLAAFVTALRDLGVPPRTVGDLPVAAAAPGRPRPRRPRRKD